MRCDKHLDKVPSAAPKGTKERPREDATLNSLRERKYIHHIFFSLLFAIVTPNGRGNYIYSLRECVRQGVGGNFDLTKYIFLVIINSKFDLVLSVCMNNKISVVMRGNQIFLEYLLFMHKVKVINEVVHVNRKINCNLCMLINMIIRLFI